MFSNYRINFLLLVITSSIILIGGFFYYHNVKELIYNDNEKSIKNISQLKSTQLQSWQTYKIMLGRHIQNDSFLVDKLIQYTNNPTDLELKSKFIKWMSEVRKNSDFSGVYLIDKNDKLILSSLDKQKTDIKNDIEIFKSLKNITISDLHMNETDKDPHMSLYVPIIKDEIITAKLVITIDPEKEFYKLLTYWPSKTETAEALLVEKDNEGVIFLNNLRFSTNSSLRLKIPLTQTQVPAIKAILKKEGIVKGEDYRGKEVIAYIQKVNDTPWWLITKIDEEEIAKQSRNQLYYIISTEFSIILLIWVYYLFRKRKGKIAHLAVQLKTEQEKNLIRTHNDYIKDNTNDAIFLIDTEGNFIDINKKAVDRYGYTIDEFRNSNVGLVLQDKQPDVVKEVVEKIIKEKEIIFEIEHITKAGVVFPVEVSSKIFQLNNKYYIQSIVRDITKRKLAESELQNSKKRFSELLEFAPIAIYTCEANGAITSYNKKALELWGRKPKLNDLSDRYCGSFKLFNKEGKFIPCEESPAALVLQTGLPKQNQELVVERPDGSRIFVLTNSIMLNNEQSENIESINAFLDISEIKKTEQALIESEMRFKMLYENAPLSYQSLDENAHIIEVNSTWYETLGYKKEDNVIGRYFGDFMTPESEALIKDRFTTFLTEGKINDYQFELIRKDSNKIVVSYNGRIGYDKNGNFKKTHCIFTDITEQKRAEIAFIKSSAVFKLLLEKLPDAVFLTRIGGENAGEILFANPEAEKQTGYSKEKLIGMNIIKDFEVYSESVELLKKRESKLMEGETISFTEKKKKADGTEYWSQVVTTVIYYENEKVILSVNRDITHIKHAEDKLSQLNKKLLKAQKIAKMGFLNWDIESNKVELSPQTCTLYGIEPPVDFVDAEILFNLIHPEDLERVRINLESAFKNAKSLQFDHRIVQPNGDTIWVQADVKPLFNIEGKVKSLTGINLDITQHKLAEAALIESEIRYRNIFDNSLIGIYKTSPDGKMLMANDALIKMFGYNSLEEFNSLSVEDTYGELNQRKEFIEIMEREGEVIGRELMGLKKDGSKIVMREYARVIRNTEGKINAYEGLLEDVTKLKEIEKSLKESEECYRMLFEQNLAGVFVTTFEGNILDCNEAFAKMFGYSNVKDISSISTLELYNNKSDREVYIEQLKKQGYVLNYNIQLKKKDGTLIWALMNVNKIDNSKIQGTIIDITEQKKILNLLEQSNEFNETLIRTIPFRLHIVDLQGNILFMNKLMKDTVGLENPTGKCWEYYKDDKKQCSICPLKKELKLSETIISEVKDVFDGKEYEITHTIMQYQNKLAALEIFRDITEFKIAQKEILKLSQGLEQSPGMVIITNIKGDIEYINSQVTKVTGYSREEIIGKNPSILASGKTPKATYELLWETIFNGNTFDGEILNKRKNGEEYWESIRISPILNSKGEIVNFIAIKVDISEKIIARDELIKAKEEAEEMNKIKSYFFANMSHELRTPFVGISGYAELLSDSVTEPEQKEFVDGILSSSKRLTDTLNKILTLSKFEFEGMVVELSQVNINQVINSAFYLFEKTAQLKNLSYTITPLKEPLIILTDEKLFSEILTNLINNAIKFTARGSISLITELEKGQTSESLLIKVIDTGEGIPLEMQDLIWHEFRQVSEGLSRKFEGTGLGLTLTKKYTELLGGTISVESQVGKGSTFTLKLPIEGRAVSENVKNKRNIISDEQSKPIVKPVFKRLLLIEDEENAIKIITTALSKLYSIDTSVTAVDALDKLKKHNYDAFLVDINLGIGTNGL